MIQRRGFLKALFAAPVVALAAVKACDDVPVLVEDVVIPDAVGIDAAYQDAGKPNPREKYTFHRDGMRSNHMHTPFMFVVDTEAERCALKVGPADTGRMCRVIETRRTYVLDHGAEWHDLRVAS